MGRLFVFLLAVGFYIAGTAAIAALGETAAGARALPEGKSALEAYQNVQVLKQIPADQLVPAMQFITYALGVECSYCHVEGALEKDDKKPKQTARKMIEMMIAINRDNFDSKQVVTCNSCHRGSPRPLAVPAIAESRPSPAGAPMDRTPPVNLPPAGLIIAKYVDAIGGTAAVARISAREERGTITISGRSLPIQILSKTGGKRITVIHLPDGDSVTAYDGLSGWTSGPNRLVYDIPSDEVRSAQSEIDLQLPLHMKQLFSELKSASPEKVGEREAYVVAAVNSGEIAAKFYFDEDSGYLVRILRYTQSPLGRNPTQIDYSDYRNQDGQKLPFQRTIARPNSRFTVQIEAARFNVPVDDSRFARPVSVQPSTPLSP